VDFKSKQYKLSRKGRLKVKSFKGLGMTMNGKDKILILQDYMKTKTIGIVILGLGDEFSLGL
jgi:hypothetical protein